MTLTINYDKKEIIIGEDCNVADLINKLNELCENPSEWTICKTVLTKEVLKEGFKELSILQRPYKNPLDPPFIVTCETPIQELQRTTAYQTNTDLNTNIS